MAEIIKKWKVAGKDMAWVTIDEDDARLFEYSKTDTDTTIKAKADEIKFKKERLKEVQKQITDIKQRYGLPL